MPDAQGIVLLEHTGKLTEELTRSGVTKSRTEAKRLLAQGAIEIDGEKVTEDVEVNSLKSGSIIKVGKHRFASL